MCELVRLCVLATVLSTSYPGAKKNSFVHMNAFEPFGPKYSLQSVAESELTRTVKTRRKDVGQKVVRTNRKDGVRSVEPGKKGRNKRENKLDVSYKSTDRKSVV